MILNDRGSTLGITVAIGRIVHENAGKRDQLEFSHHDAVLEIVYRLFSAFGFGLRGLRFRVVRLASSKKYFIDLGVKKNGVLTGTAARSFSSRLALP
jgi:hypothetical protein